MTVIVNTIEADIYALAPKLRQEDKEELYAATGMKPLEALLHAYVASDKHVIKTIFVGDEQVGIFGVNPSAVSGIGFIWMLGTDKLKLLRKELVTEARTHINHFCTIYPVLTNVVYSKNITHIKWLHKLGFKFLRRYDNMGYKNKYSFYHFIYHDIPIDIMDVIKPSIKETKDV
jgi:hypothetical protein